ncbi:MAG: LSM domain-containing protein [Candidatus Hodarchaeota archaeon]
MQKILGQNLGKEVLILMRWGVSIRGVLKAVDAQLNCIIEKADEIVEGGAKPLGTILIRGDNIIMVSASV